MISIEAKAHEIKRFCVKAIYLPISLEAQTIVCKPTFDLAANLMQLLLAAAEHHHVIHIAQIVDCTKLLLNGVVYVGDKEIGENLRKQHANGQAVRFAKDRVNEAQQPFILDAASQLVHEPVGFDGWIELRDVHLQVILRVLMILTYPALHVFLAVMHAPSGDAAARKFIKAAVYPIADRQIDAPMHHLIWIKARLEDVSLLVAGAFNHALGLIVAGDESFFLEHCLQAAGEGFFVLQYMTHISAATLAFGGKLNRAQDGVIFTNNRVKVSFTLHVASFLITSRRFGA